MKGRGHKHTQSGCPSTTWMSSPEVLCQFCSPILVRGEPASRREAHYRILSNRASCNYNFAQQDKAVDAGRPPLEIITLLEAALGLKKDQKKVRVQSSFRRSSLIGSTPFSLIYEGQPLRQRLLRVISSNRSR